MTIAKQLKIKEFPFIIKDSEGKEIYYEDSERYWSKRKYDSEGNQIYFDNSKGYWVKSEYDSNGKEIYYEDSTGYWIKRKWDSKGNEIYYENSDGTITDNRPKTDVQKAMEQELLNQLQKLLAQYEERLPKIANERFYTDREEASAWGKESELEDVIRDLKRILLIL
jgi:hypothetical protein